MSFGGKQATPSPKSKPKLDVKSDTKPKQRQSPSVGSVAEKSPRTKDGSVAEPDLSARSPAGPKSSSALRSPRGGVVGEQSPNSPGSIEKQAKRRSRSSLGSGDETARGLDFDAGAGKGDEKKQVSKVDDKNAGKAEEKQQPAKQDDRKHLPKVEDKKNATGIEDKKQSLKVEDKKVASKGESKSPSIKTSPVMSVHRKTTISSEMKRRSPSPFSATPRGKPEVLPLTEPLNLESKGQHTQGPAAHIEEDLWTCRECGWTYPNAHPSAKHRRTHKKHCAEIKAKKAEGLHVQGGSSDEASSDDESSVQEAQSTSHVPQVVNSLEGTSAGTAGETTLIGNNAAASGHEMVGGKELVAKVSGSEESPDDDLPAHLLSVKARVESFERKYFSDDGIGSPGSHGSPRNIGSPGKKLGFQRDSPISSPAKKPLLPEGGTPLHAQRPLVLESSRDAAEKKPEGMVDAPVTDVAAVKLSEAVKNEQEGRTVLPESLDEKSGTLEALKVTKPEILESGKPEPPQSSESAAKASEPLGNVGQDVSVVLPQVLGEENSVPEVVTETKFEALPRRKSEISESVDVADGKLSKTGDEGVQESQSTEESQTVLPPVADEKSVTFEVVEEVKSEVSKSRISEVRQSASTELTTTLGVSEEMHWNTRDSEQGTGAEADGEEMRVKQGLEKDVADLSLKSNLQPKSDDVVVQQPAAKEENAPQPMKQVDLVVPTVSDKVDKHAVDPNQECEPQLGSGAGGEPVDVNEGIMRDLGEKPELQQLVSVERATDKDVLDVAEGSEPRPGGQVELLLEEGTVPDLVESTLPMMIKDGKSLGDEALPPLRPKVEGGTEKDVLDLDRSILSPLADVKTPDVETRPEFAVSTVVPVLPTVLNQANDKSPQFVADTSLEGPGANVEPAKHGHGVSGTQSLKPDVKEVAMGSSEPCKGVNGDTPAYQAPVQVRVDDEHVDSIEAAKDINKSSKPLLNSGSDIASDDVQGQILTAAPAAPQLAGGHLPVTQEAPLVLENLELAQRKGNNSLKECAILSSSAPAVETAEPDESNIRGSEGKAPTEEQVVDKSSGVPSEVLTDDSSLALGSITESLPSVEVRGDRVTSRDGGDCQLASSEKPMMSATSTEASARSEDIVERELLTNGHGHEVAAVENLVAGAKEPEHKSGGSRGEANLMLEPVIAKASAVTIPRSGRESHEKELWERLLEMDLKQNSATSIATNDFATGAAAGLEEKLLQKSVLLNADFPGDDGIEEIAPASGVMDAVKAVANPDVESTTDSGLKKVGDVKAVDSLPTHVKEEAKFTESVERKPESEEIKVPDPSTTASEPTVDAALTRHVRAVSEAGAMASSSKFESHTENGSNGVEKNHRHTALKSLLAEAHQSEDPEQVTRAPEVKAVPSPPTKSSSPFLKRILDKVRSSPPSAAATSNDDGNNINASEAVGGTKRSLFSCQCFSPAGSK